MPSIPNISSQFNFFIKLHCCRIVQLFPHKFPNSPNTSLKFFDSGRPNLESGIAPTNTSPPPTPNPFLGHHHRCAAALFVFGSGRLCDVKVSSSLSESNRREEGIGGRVRAGRIDKATKFAQVSRRRNPNKEKTFTGGCHIKCHMELFIWFLCQIWPLFLI